MSLPEAAPNGYLPVGVHTGTLDEIESRFATNAGRRELMEMVKKVVSTLATIPEVKRLILDGCFIGPRVDTRDVEIIALLEPRPGTASDADLVEKMRTLRKGSAPRIELFWFLDGSTRANVLTAFFQEDKPEHGGVPKGIVELERFR